MEPEEAKEKVCPLKVITSAVGGAKKCLADDCMWWVWDGESTCAITHLAKMVQSIWESEAG